MAIRRTLTFAGLALTGALLWAPAAPAYLIILKDGTRIEAADKPVAQGRNYLFNDKLGAKKMIAIAEVDPRRPRRRTRRTTGTPTSSASPSP